MSVYVFDEFVFDEGRLELTRSGEVLKTDGLVLELLAYLVKNPNRLVSKEELAEAVWQRRIVGDSVIGVCVAKLRKTLGGPVNRFIVNAYGRGYRFLPVVTVRHTTAPPPTVRPLQSSRGPEIMVGRDSVTDQLAAALAGVQAGRGRLVALLGEPGIGKTRVAQTLDAGALQAGLEVAWGHCHPFGNVPPLWPLLQIFRAWGVGLPASERSAAADASSEAGASLEIEPSDRWQETVLLMTETVRAQCARHPQVMILEDLHWADAATLQLLSHWVAGVSQLPLLIVLTVRNHEEPPARRSQRVLDYVIGHADCTRMTLSRLLESDVEAYIAALFGSSDNALTGAVYAKSGGNPFFMVELLRPFVDGRKPAPDELSLSGAALEIVRHSLRLLPAETHELLATASVIGRNFDLGLLSSVVGRSSEVLLEQLERALSTRMIVPARNCRTQFVFGHDLIRDVLYGELPSSTRARLHLQVADGLSQRSTSETSVTLPELARHLLEALPVSSPARAVAATQEAARAAARIGAHADACTLLRRALDALSLLPEAEPHAECMVLFDLARYGRAAGDPGCGKRLQQALLLARRHEIVEVLVPASQIISGAPGTVTMEGAGEVLEDALRALTPTEHGNRAKLLAHLSWTAPHSWDAQRVSEMLDEASALASTSGNDAKRSVLRAQLYYGSGPDQYEQAQSLLHRARNLVVPGCALRRARWTLEAEMTRVVLLLQRGEMLQAQDAIERFGVAARELHHAEMIWHYDRMRMIMRMNAGDFAYARTRLAELRARAEQIQLYARDAVLFEDWGELMRHTAPEPPQLNGLAGRLLPVSSDGPLNYARKLRIMAQFGLHDEARAALAELPVERLARLPKSREYLAIVGYLAFVAIETRSLEHAAALYDLLAPYEPLCIVSVSLHCHGPVSQMLGGLAKQLSRRELAIEHYQRALRDGERYGLAPQVAQAQQELSLLI